MTASVIGSLKVVHDSLSAEFTDKDGIRKDFERTVDNRNEALRKFDDMVRNGFPDPKNPKTAEDLAEIFDK